MRIDRKLREKSGYEENDAKQILARIVKLSEEV